MDGFLETLAGRPKAELVGVIGRLSAAEHLLQHGDHDFAVSRAYYGMFYAAQALLLTRDVRRTKHSGVVAAFNEQFIQTGELPRRLSSR